MQFFWDTVYNCLISNHMLLLHSNIRLLVYVILNIRSKMIITVKQITIIKHTFSNVKTAHTCALHVSKCATWGWLTVQTSSCNHQKDRHTADLQCECGHVCADWSQVKTVCHSLQRCTADRQARQPAVITQQFLLSTHNTTLKTVPTHSNILHHVCQLSIVCTISFVYSSSSLSLSVLFSCLSDSLYFILPSLWNKRICMYYQPAM